jgi:hypothetical protein
MLALAIEFSTIHNIRSQRLNGPKPLERGLTVRFAEQTTTRHNIGWQKAQNRDLQSCTVCPTHEPSTLLELVITAEAVPPAEHGMLRG